MAESMSKLLDAIEILKAVKEIDSEWQGYTDDFAIHENLAKTQARKIALELQIIHSIPDPKICDRKMGEFIKSLLEEVK